MVLEQPLIKDILVFYQVARVVSVAMTREKHMTFEKLSNSKNMTAN